MCSMSSNVDHSKYSSNEKSPETKDTCARSLSTFYVCSPLYFIYDTLRVLSLLHSQSASTRFRGTRCTSHCSATTVIFYSTIALVWESVVKSEPNAVSLINKYCNREVFVCTMGPNYCGPPGNRCATVVPLGQTHSTKEVARFR